MLFQGWPSTFTNFLADAFAIFMFVLWFWLLVIVAGDLFRRNDISGWAKVLWVILLIVLPYIGIFAYLLTQSQGMAERNQARAKEARERVAPDRRGFSTVPTRIEKLDRLKSGWLDFRARIRAPEGQAGRVANPANALPLYSTLARRQRVKFTPMA